MKVGIIMDSKIFKLLELIGRLNKLIDESNDLFLQRVELERKKAANTFKINGLIEVVEKENT